MVYTTLEHDLVLTHEPMRNAIGAILDAHPEIRVVILDNISCLFSGISEDSKQDWEPFNAWLVRLRHRGLSVVLVHHAGKTGQQRGTSGREDVLDTVIALSWPPQYDPCEGCHFHLKFTKTRSIKGEAVKALDVRLESVKTEGLTWTVAALEDSYKTQIRRLLDEGLSPTEIIKELTVDASYVYRIKREVSQS
jgi:putative DNA primase/helicase